MSNIVRFDVYGSRPVTAADVEAAFGSGASVVPRLGSSFRVRVGECVFELRGYPSIDDGAFVRWLAARRGRAGFAALHGAEVDGAYLDSDRYGGLGERVRAGFAALAERIDGIVVVLDEGAGEYTDPVSGDVYTFAQAGPPAGGGRLWRCRGSGSWGRGKLIHCSGGLTCAVSGGPRFPPRSTGTRSAGRSPTASLTRFPVLGASIRAPRCWATGCSGRWTSRWRRRRRRAVTTA